MLSLTNSNEEEKNTWKNDLGLNRNEILYRLQRIAGIAGDWCAINETITKKIAAMREKLDIPLNKCPCDPMNTDRGCIGKQCMKELIEQGVCHCNCFFRLWLNKEEVEAILNYYKLDVQEFYKFIHDGSAGGVINDVFYFHPWDVDRYLCNCCNIVASINTPLVLLAQKIIKEKQGGTSKANGTQDNSELPLSSPPS